MTTFYIHENKLLFWNRHLPYEVNDFLNYTEPKKPTKVTFENIFYFIYIKNYNIQICTIF